MCVCLCPPQSLAWSHLWVCRCQLSHSQHSPSPDFGPCPLMAAALLKLTSLEIWWWHCPCTCLLCSTLEHMLDSFESHRLKSLPLILNAHISFCSTVGTLYTILRLSVTGWMLIPFLSSMVFLSSQPCARRGAAAILGYCHLTKGSGRSCLLLE